MCDLHSLEYSHPRADVRDTTLQFKLPKFDPDIKMALRKDAVYNPQKRAKIVRKACEALLGFTRESDTEVC